MKPSTRANLIRSLILTAAFGIALIGLRVIPHGGAALVFALVVMAAAIAIAVRAAS